MSFDREFDPYRLRSVRVGVYVTVLAVLALAGYPLLDDGRIADRDAYWSILGTALVAVGLVASLPWERLFDRGWGVRLLYAWSMADIAFVSVAIAVTGGDTSPLWGVYMLTSIFFATSYPVAGQAGLLVFTVASYLAAIAVAPSGVSAPADVYVRITILALTTVMSSFLSRELLDLMRTQNRHRNEAERQAAMLAQISAASRRLQTLSTTEVHDAVVDAVAGMGFPVVGLSQLDLDDGTFRLVAVRGLPEEVAAATHPIAGVVADAIAHGRVVVSTDVDDVEVPGQPATPLSTAVAAPIVVRDRAVAVLGGATADTEGVRPQVIAGVELLASFAGRALELAALYESEQRAVDRLERLDALKRDFVSNVSHELRTPLTVMQGVGELLQARWRGLDDDMREQLIDRLLRHTESLHRTILSLLDFSRLDAGRLEARPEPVDLTALVGASLERLRSVLAAHPVSVVAPPEAIALVDPSLVERVLDNLLVNAATHTPAGTPVAVSLSVAPDATVLEVADRGPGIPADELDQITQRFFRGGDPDTRPSRGLGLGLALVREIAQLHGTELEITSLPGQGARFRLTLPAPALVAG